MQGSAHNVKKERTTFGPQDVEALIARGREKGSLTFDELNEALLQADAFEGPNLRSAKAAELLGLDYAGKVTEIDEASMTFPTIREVDYTRDGGEFVRHVVVQVRGADGEVFVVDPDGGVKRPLDYDRFVSYRLFARRAPSAVRGASSSSSAASYEVGAP